MQPSNSKIFHIAWPVLVSLLMEHLIGMTDTAFLGRVGEVELAASAIATVYYLAIFMLGFGFSTGVQILIGGRNGKKDYKNIGNIFTQGILFQFILAVILFGASKMFSPILLKNMIQSEQVYLAMMEYLDWRVYGFFFSFVALIFRAFYVGTTNTKTLTINSLVMVGSNVVLNYLLIFGKFGFPELGIAGAAIASSISEFISLLFFVIYTHIRIDYKKYNLFVNMHLKRSMIKRILTISLWTMIQSFISISTWFIFFLAIEHLGERPLAVTNILRNIASFFFIIVGAFATTASTLVSNLMGSGHQEFVMPTIKKVCKLCYLIGLPIMLLFLIAPELIMRIYTTNVELVSEAVPAFYVMIFVFVVSVPACILFNSISGTGNARSAFIVEILALVIYVLSIFYIVIWQKSDVAICWLTEYIYFFVMGTLALWYMKRGSWRKSSVISNR